MKLSVWDTVVTANLTSDKETGIGSYTDDELLRAVTRGIRRDGTRMLPFPMGWTAYAHWTDGRPKGARGLPAHASRRSATQIPPRVSPGFFAYLVRQVPHAHRRRRQSDADLLRQRGDGVVRRGGTLTRRCAMLKRILKWAVFALVVARQRSGSWRSSISFRRSRLHRRRRTSRQDAEGLLPSLASHHGSGDARHRRTRAVPRADLGLRGMPPAAGARERGAVHVPGGRHAVRDATATARS